MDGVPPVFACAASRCVKILVLCVGILNITRLLILYYSLKGKQNSFVLTINIIRGTTIRNTAIDAPYETVLREPHLKHYQQWFISYCPF
jgi:hypothetical protein